MLAFPASVAAAAPAGAIGTEFLLMLAAVLIGAKLMGELAQRMQQPAVLGELIAGVLLGPSVLSLVDPASPVIFILAEIGVVILLFEIGLETQLKKLLQVGGASAAVALVGVALPFALGYGLMTLMGFTTYEAIISGAALTATSVGITARVLSDLGRLQEPEGQIVLGAAVIDDVVGLIILAVVSQLVAGEALSVFGVAKTTLIAFGFLAVVLAVGGRIVPRLFNVLAKVGGAQSLAIVAIALAFALSVAAQAAGSALIIGAFAAGLMLAPTTHAHTIEEGTVSIGQFFVPIFFVSVGAAVDVRSFLDPRVLLTGLALIVVAVIGKFAAGYAPWWFKGRKAVIGVGMVPRGEVGLIFAQAGLAAGVLSEGLFGALMMMVVVTTFAAPPTLRALFRSSPPPAAGSSRDAPGYDGVSAITSDI